MKWPEKIKGDVALATLHALDQADHTLPHNVAQSGCYSCSAVKTVFDVLCDVICHLAVRRSSHIRQRL